MRFRNQVAWALLVQGGSAAAGLVSIALLGYYLGPAAQGVFSLIKLEVTFIGSLAILGLTQSLFYFVQASRMSIGRAKKLAVVSALLGGILAMGYGIFVQHWAGFDLVAFVFAGTAYVWFSCLRGVALVAVTTRLFNLMTAMPQGLLLLYAGIAVVAGRINNFDVALAFVASYALSAVIGTCWLAVSQMAPSVAKEERLRSVMQYGFFSCVAEIAASVSLLLAAKAVATRLGAVDLGVFTFSVTLSQGLLVPISYSLPLLFKRWMEHPVDVSEAVKGGFLVFLMFSGVALVARFFLSNLHPGSLLGVYSAMADFLWIVLFATAFDGFQRIITAYANAQGAPWLSATSETLRMIVVALGLALWPIQQVRDVAWIVCIAAIFSSAMPLAVYRRVKLVTEGLAI